AVGIDAVGASAAVSTEVRDDSAGDARSLVGVEVITGEQCIQVEAQDGLLWGFLEDSAHTVPGGPGDGPGDVGHIEPLFEDKIKQPFYEETDLNVFVILIQSASSKKTPFP
ncbi:MAG: hypothetical protein Q9174_004713, partial [Haloplaca sp. 1 TL-2023]